jgi:hypothetical protein
MPRSDSAMKFRTGSLTERSAAATTTIFLVSDKRCFGFHTGHLLLITNFAALNDMVSVKRYILNSLAGTVCCVCEYSIHDNYLYRWSGPSH